MIRGVVLDADSDTPIAVAQVSLLDRNQGRLETTVTDGEGRFAFELRYPGRYHLRAIRIGYAEVTTMAFDVLAGEVMQVEVRISTRPIALPPLTVIGERPPRVLDPWLERGGYYEREARYNGGFGQFMGEEELNRIPAMYLYNLFRMTPGLRVRHTGGRTLRVSDRLGRPICWYLDGRPLRRVDPEEVVTPSMLVAVEIYSRGVLPGDFDCYGGSLIALWTGIRDP